jgi:hypothetical protein
MDRIESSKRVLKSKFPAIEGPKECRATTGSVEFGDIAIINN